MPQLLDQYGTPIDTKRLLREEATPTLAGVRPILSGHPAQGLTPSRLARILLQAEQGDPTAYLELAEEMEEKDLHYRAVLSTRRLQVAQLPISIEAAGDDPASQKAADLARRLLVDSGVVSAYLYDMLDAIGKGWSVGEIRWRLTTGEWIPDSILWRDPRWFEFDRTDGTTVLLRGGPDGTGQPTPLKPYGHIVHAHRTKSGVPVRGGLARATAWMYLFKNFGVKAWVEFVEVYGQPLRIGKYGPGASDRDKSTLLRAVQSIAKDAAAIIPSSMIMELIESKATGTGIHRDLAQYADAQISKAVLGQTGTTDTGQYVGTANAHDKVKDDIEADDAMQISATLTRQLLRPVIDLNLGGQATYPRLVVRRPDPVDTERFLSAVKTFVELGGEVEQSVVRDRIGLPDPPKGPDVKLLRPTGAGSGPTADQPATAAALATAAARTPGAAVAADDALDALAADALDGWEQMMDPLISPLEQLIADCADAEEFKRRLPEVLAAMDTATLTDALARAGFTARLAGDSETDISG